MFIFGHLGFARLIAKPFDKLMPLGTVLLGSLLPDIIDKSVFYFLNLAPGTRSLAHTFIVLLFVATIEKRIVKAWSRCALACGVFTHQFCDYVGDLLVVPEVFSRDIKIFLWPALCILFPSTAHLSAVEQALRMTEPYFMTTEIAGLFLLIFLRTSVRSKAV